MNAEKTVKYTFQNEFHNTTAKAMIPEWIVNGSEGDPIYVWSTIQGLVESGRFSKATYNRLRKQLCGMKDCRCENVR